MKCYHDCGNGCGATDKFTHTTRLKSPERLGCRGALGKNEGLECNEFRKGVK